MTTTQQNDVYAAYSLVAKRQYELTRSGIDPKQARNQAAEEVGALMSPPMDAKTLELWMARNRSQANPRAKDKTKPHKRVTDVYEQWVENNNVVGSDEMLSHFTGATRGAFGYARQILKAKGWEFERVEKGRGAWRVTKRPAQSAAPNGRVLLDVTGLPTQAVEVLANAIRDLKKGG